jgi:NADH-quinone oxidoreductase subunit E
MRRYYLAAYYEHITAFSIWFLASKKGVRMEEVLATTDRIIDAHEADREALVEILREVNDESQGHLTRAQLQHIAERMALPLSKVYSVASFYSLISLEPLGRHVIRFCQDAPCHVAGGKEVWDALEHELGIPFGTTTLDGQWSLLTTSCIGACAVGPVMTVDGDIYGNLTPNKVREIIAHYRDLDAADVRHSQTAETHWPSATAAQGGQA